MTTRLQNLYIARLTTQERPCFVCSKFTTVVLTLADNSNNDWFYTCRSHLGDFNFCSKVGGSSPKPATPSASPRTSNLKDRPAESDSVVDLVSSIGSAITSWRKKPEDKDKDTKEKDKDDNKDDNKDGKDGKDDQGKDDDKTDTTASSSSSTSRPSSPPLTTSPQPQSPPKFILQRDYFYLRQREYMKKQQKKEADEKLKTLQFPKVPTSLPSPK